jgi:ketosteroid isomerase-like protein
MNPKEIAEKYFALWTAKQCAQAGELMASDIVCRTPRSRFKERAELVAAITRFTQQMKAARLEKLTVDGSDAFLLYEVDLPSGTLRTSEHQRIEGGRVRSIELVYDTAAMSVKSLAQQYFEAWTSKSYERVRAMFADDLKWESPVNRFSTADEVMPGFKRFVDMVQSAKLLKLVADENDAALLYECQFPFGPLRMTTWLQFEGGKIRSVQLTFDPTSLPKAKS